MQGVWWALHSPAQGALLDACLASVRFLCMSDQVCLLPVHPLISFLTSLPASEAQLVAACISDAARLLAAVCKIQVRHLGRLCTARNLSRENEQGLLIGARRAWGKQQRGSP